jgi:hypothetical protein
MKVAQLEPRCLERRGSLPPSKSPYNLSLECFDADDWTDDCACGADDVAGALYAGQRIRKLRFLMTDNSKAYYLTGGVSTAANTEPWIVWSRAAERRLCRLAD